MKKYSTQLHTLCVWPATLLKGTGLTETDFEDWLMIEFKVKGKYIEEFKTLPDVQNNKAVSDTGDRNDLVFFISNKDVFKFAIPRLSFGISWWDDYVNNNHSIIPKAILDKYPDVDIMDESDFENETSNS